MPATGQAVLLDDVTAFENYVDTFPGARSEVCVPVRFQDRVIAVINLESTTPAAFREQVPLLQTIADQVAGAVANARLYEEVTRRAGHLEMIGEVSRRALEAVELQALMGSRGGAPPPPVRGSRSVRIVLLDEAMENISMVAHHGDVPSQRPAGTTLGRAGGCRVWWGGPSGPESRSWSATWATIPTTSPINPDVVAEYAVPILFAGRVLGVLNLDSTSAELFSSETLMVLRTLADQIAGAIHLASANRDLGAANQMLRDLFSRYVAPRWLRSCSRIRIASAIGGSVARPVCCSPTSGASPA